MKLLPIPLTLASERLPPQSFHPIHPNLLQILVATYFRLPKVPYSLLHFLATLKT